MARPRSAGDGDACWCPGFPLCATSGAAASFPPRTVAQLDADGGTDDRSAYADRVDPVDPEAESALREVDAVVAAGARRALADIELALVRMATGRYGLCRSCGAGIPLVVLEAIPKTTLCLKCAWRSEGSDAGEPRPPHARTSRSSTPARPRRPSVAVPTRGGPCAVRPVSGALGQVVAEDETVSAVPSPGRIAPGSGYHEITPVAEGGRRYRPDQQVANDAAADRRDHAQSDRPDDVQPGHPQRGHRGTEGAGQVEDEQESRLAAPGCLRKRWQRSVGSSGRRASRISGRPVGASQARLFAADGAGPTPARTGSRSGGPQAVEESVEHLQSESSTSDRSD